MCNECVTYINCLKLRMWCVCAGDRICVPGGRHVCVQQLNTQVGLVIHKLTWPTPRHWRYWHPALVTHTILMSVESNVGHLAVLQSQIQPIEQSWAHYGLQHVLTLHTLMNLLYQLFFVMLEVLSILMWVLYSVTSITIVSNLYTINIFELVFYIYCDTFVYILSCQDCIFYSHIFAT